MQLKIKTTTTIDTHIQIQFKSGVLNELPPIGCWTEKNGWKESIREETEIND